MTREHHEMAKELAAAAAHLTKAGLMRGWSGQLSARSNQDDGSYRIVLKRSGGSADEPSAYCGVDSKGQNPDPSDARSSIVTSVHCAIYSSCLDVHSIIQCRGLYTDAVATVLGEMPLSLESYWALKNVPVVLPVNALRSDTIAQYVEKMALAVSGALVKPEAGTSAVCIPFYGMWITGSTVAESVGRALAIEDISKAAYLHISLAGSLGVPKPDFPSWFRDILQNLPRPRVS